MPELHVATENGIARIWLDRPQVLNALSPELLNKLIDVCGDLATDESTKVVILQGSGEHFSAGADLLEFSPRIAADPHPVADLGRRATVALAALPQITIAAIRGYCVGGAMVLAAACDLRVAASDSRFSIPELDAGIPLAWGGMVHLVRLVGESLATDLVLSCRSFDADVALRSGFVSRVLATEEFGEEVTGLAELIVGKPKLSLRLTKQQLQAIRRCSFDARSDADALLQALEDPESIVALQEYVAGRFGE